MNAKVSASPVASVIANVPSGVEPPTSFMTRSLSLHRERHATRADREDLVDAGVGHVARSRWDEVGGLGPAVGGVPMCVDDGRGEAEDALVERASCEDQVAVGGHVETHGVVGRGDGIGACVSCVLGHGLTGDDGGEERGGSEGDSFHESLLQQREVPHLPTLWSARNAGKTRVIR